MTFLLISICVVSANHVGGPRAIKLFFSSINMDRQVHGSCLSLPTNEDDTDWTYEMRREMQEIIPGLYLGPYSAASKSKCDHLRKHKITHIVCIRHDLEAHFIKPNFPDLFKYLELDIADNFRENIIQHIPKVTGYVDDCFANGGRVLVHGNAGISRSASLVIAYVMETYGLGYRDAFSMVQQRRFCISPNERFAQQLKEYEPIYRAKHSFVGKNALPIERCLKRSFEVSEEIFQSHCEMDTTS